MHFPAWLFVMVVLGACSGAASENTASSTGPGPADQQADAFRSFRDSSYRTLDSIGFVANGRRFDLIILEHVEDWEAARPLLLYRYQDNVRDLLIRNDSLVLCRTCGGVFGDPYDGVRFANDTLRIHHYGGSAWRWSITHAFVPGRDEDWPLVRRTEISYWVHEPDSTRTIEESTTPGTGLRDCNSYR